MSSGFQHKIYNYEVIPPVDTWEKITASLDESHLTDKFPSKLYSTVAIPPALIWETIAANLDELNLSTQYPSTLYNMQAPPPATAWEKIKVSLEEDQEKAIPRQRRIPAFIRYAAAAVLIGAVAFGAVRILNTTKKNDDQTAVNSTPPGLRNNDTSNKTDNIHILPDSNNEITPSLEARNDAALEESRHTFASLDHGDQVRMKKVSDEFFQTSSDPINAAADFNPASTYQDLECDEVNTPAFAGGPSSIDMASRYVMLMTPDGRIIRISKKLGDLFCCVSGEEVDEECKDQLKKWRQKIADSPVAPAPGNFMDILDLLHSLKDSRL